MKKIIALLLSFILAVSVLTGCSSTSDEDEAVTTAEAATAAEEEETEEITAAESDTRVVTDLLGNSVTISSEIESVAITSWKGAFESFVLLGRLDLVTCMCDTSRYIWLKTIYPEIDDIPNYGSFNDVSIEELIDLDPDIIFSPQAASDATEQMLELGLPVYVDGITTQDDPYQGFQDELVAIADLIGESEKAEEYLQWEEDLLNLIAERVADIPDDEKKTVYLMRNSNTETFNEQYIMGLAVSLAGGINVAADAFDDNFYGEVDAEQVVEWDPDYIFQYCVGYTGDELVTKYTELCEDERFSTLTAVTNGDVYIMPFGIQTWGGAIESALGVLVIAKTIYPDLFEDISIADYAADFYATFLGYELTDEDWEYISYNCEGANELVLD